MATIDNKIEYKKRITPRQKMWNYLRRNRNFRFGDVMIICDIGFLYLKHVLKSLERSGYVKIVEKTKPYSNRRYTLVKNTGALAPSITKHGIYDHNTGDEFVFRKSKEVKKDYVPETLQSILLAIDTDMLSKYDLSVKANVSETTLKKWWAKLRHIGVIGEILLADENDKKKTPYKIKYKKSDTGYQFRFYPLKAKELLSQLKNGAYRFKNSQVQQLWNH